MQAEKIVGKQHQPRLASAVGKRGSGLSSTTGISQEMPSAYKHHERIIIEASPPGKATKRNHHLETSA